MLAWTAGAEAQARGVSPWGVSTRGVSSTSSFRDAVWPLAPTPMAVCASAAIIPVVIMCHDKYR